MLRADLSQLLRDLVLRMAPSQSYHGGHDDDPAESLLHGPVHGLGKRRAAELVERDANGEPGLRGDAPGQFGQPRVVGIVRRGPRPLADLAVQRQPLGEDGSITALPPAAGEELLEPGRGPVERLPMPSRVAASAAGSSSTPV